MDVLVVVEAASETSCVCVIEIATVEDLLLVVVTVMETVEDISSVVARLG